MNWPGNLDTIFANMIREIPFPMPWIFISSPSHIMRVVPAVSVITIRTTCGISKSGKIVEEKCHCY